MSAGGGFSAMSGSDLIRFMRETIFKEATRQRGMLEALSKVPGCAPPSPAEWQRVRVLEAAGYVFLHIEACGDEAKMRRAGQAAQGRAARVEEFPEWIVKIAAQARSSLVGSDRVYDEEG